MSNKQILLGYWFEYFSHVEWIWFYTHFWGVKLNRIVRPPNKKHYFTIYPPSTNFLSSVKHKKDILKNLEENVLVNIEFYCQNNIFQRRKSEDDMRVSKGWQHFHLPSNAFLINVTLDHKTSHKRKYWDIYIYIYIFGRDITIWKSGIRGCKKIKFRIVRKSPLKLSKWSS